MSGPSLHPNLAKVAAAYDEIVERLNRRAVSPAEAYAQIARLEARDDDGARWAIDPVTGQWFRRTAFGDAEFDTAPPTYGYNTADAHSLSPNHEVFNPADRLTLHAVDDTVARYPGSLQGATRRLPAEQPAAAQTWWRTALTSKRARVVAAAAAAALGLALLAGHLHGSDPAPTAPAPTQPAAVAVLP